MIQVKGNGGGLPKGWEKPVTAKYREKILPGAPIEYRRFDGAYPWPVRSVATGTGTAPENNTGYITFTADNKLLLTGVSGGSLFSRNGDNWNFLAKTGARTIAAISPNGKYIAQGNEAYTYAAVRTVGLNGELGAIVQITGDIKSYAVGFAPFVDDNILVVGSLEGPYTVYTYRLSGEYPDNAVATQIGTAGGAGVTTNPAVYGLTFSPNGRLMALFGSGMFATFSKNSAGAYNRLENPLNLAVPYRINVCFSPDGRFMLAVYGANNATMNYRVYAINDDSVYTEFRSGTITLNASVAAYSANGVSFTLDGKYVGVCFGAAVQQRYAIAFCTFNKDTGELILLPVHPSLSASNSVSGSMTLSPDGRFLYALSTISGLLQFATGEDQFISNFTNVMDNKFFNLNSAVASGIGYAPQGGAEGETGGAVIFEPFTEAMRESAATAQDAQIALANLGIQPE